MGDGAIIQNLSKVLLTKTSRRQSMGISSNASTLQ